MKKKQIAGLIAAIIVFAASFLIPVSAGIGRDGITVLALALSLLIMLAFRVLPIVCICLAGIAVMLIFGVTNGLSMTLSGFASKVPAFILASYALAEGFTKTHAAKRITRGLLGSLSGKSVRGLLLAMMIGTAMLSAVTSNVPTCAIFMAIALSFIDLYPDDEQRERTGRAFMIGIPVASMIGGMMTPAGSSINIYALTIMERYFETDVSFISWLCAGIPIAVFALPVAWLLIVRFIKPCDVDERLIRSFVNNLAVPDKPDAKEKKVIIVTAAMIVLWIVSSWIPSLDIVTVSIIGAFVLFLPGMRVLDAKTFLRDMTWEPVLLAGTLISVSDAMFETGAAEIFAGSVSGSALIPGLAVTVLIMFVLLAAFPSAPAVLVFFTPALCALSTRFGVYPSVCIAALAFCACNCWLLPLDTVTRLTYGTGYYSASDMLRTTLPLQIWLIIIISLWLPVAGHAFAL